MSMSIASGQMEITIITEKEKGVSKSMGTDCGCLKRQGVSNLDGIQARLPMVPAS